MSPVYRTLNWRKMMSYVITEDGREAWEVDQAVLNKNLQVRGIIFPAETDEERKAREERSFSPLQWTLRKVFKKMFYDRLEVYKEEEEQLNGKSVRIFGRDLQELMIVFPELAEEIMYEWTLLVGCNEVLDHASAGHLSSDPSVATQLSPYDVFDQVLRFLV